MAYNASLNFAISTSSTSGPRSKSALTGVPVGCRLRRGRRRGWCCSPPRSRSDQPTRRKGIRGRTSAGVTEEEEEGVGYVYMVFVGSSIVLFCSTYKDDPPVFSYIPLYSLMFCHQVLSNFLEEAPKSIIFLSTLFQIFSATLKHFNPFCFPSILLLSLLVPGLSPLPCRDRPGRLPPDRRAAAGS